MKSLSSGLTSHLQGETTTLAELVRITREDGQIASFTTHDADIVYDGVVYVADGAYSGGSLNQGSLLRQEPYDVEGILSSDRLSCADIEAGLYDNARIDVFLCNWADLTQGVLHLRRGWIGEVSYDQNRYCAQFRGLGDLLRSRVGETYTPECRFDLGCARCRVDLDSLAVTGSVTETVGPLAFKDSARTEDSGYFNHAKLTWTDGGNAGTSVEVNNWDAEQKLFTLWLPVVRAVEVGDAYRVAPGCDKRFSTCRARFNNGENYGGFPHLPGLGRILLYPDGR